MYINKISKHFWKSTVDIAINSLLLSIIAVIFQLRIFAHRIDAHYSECNVVSPLNELHAFVKPLKSMRVYIKRKREKEKYVSSRESLLHRRTNGRSIVLPREYIL